MISCRRGHGNIDGSYLPTDPYSYSKVPSQEKEKGLIPFYTPSAVGCSRLTDKLWSVAHTVLPHRKLDTWITHPMTTANSTRTSLKAGQAKRAPCMKVAFVARRRSHVALEANRSWLWWPRPVDRNDGRPSERHSQGSLFTKWGRPCPTTQRRVSKSHP